MAMTVMIVHITPRNPLHKPRHPPPISLHHIFGVSLSPPNKPFPTWHPYPTPLCRVRNSNTHCRYFRTHHRCVLNVLNVLLGVYRRVGCENTSSEDLHRPRGRPGSVTLAPGAVRVPASRAEPSAPAGNGPGCRRSGQVGFMCLPLDVHMYIVDFVIRGFTYFFCLSWIHFCPLFFSRERRESIVLGRCWRAGVLFKGHLHD